MAVVVNILIKDSDASYYHGMKMYLTALFDEEYQMATHFMTVFDSFSISRADIIVLAFCKGEYLTCLPEFQLRRNSIIIGVLDKMFNRQIPIPSCIRDIQFVERGFSLERIKSILLRAWKANSKTYALNKHCPGCQRIELSSQQARIMIRLYNGKTFSVIAEELRINEKTIFGHKYHMMHKFNLTSDYELLRLTKRLMDKKSAHYLSYLEGN